jgi:transcriptional regulator with XRE-family HTH domain
MQDTLDFIRQGLADRRPSIVAAKTGLHINTITRIRDGVENNPKLETLNRLAAYLNGASQ